MIPTAIQATFSSFRLVQGRKVCQLIFEVPIEAADNALSVLGGVMRNGKRMSDFEDKSFDMIERLQKRIADKDHHIKSLEAEVTEVRRVSTYYEKRIVELKAALRSRPDVSGLIEAAEIAEKIAKADEVEQWVERDTLLDFAKHLRSRAADRSA